MRERLKSRYCDIIRAMENKIKCPRCGNEEGRKAGKPGGKQQ